MSYMNFTENPSYQKMVQRIQRIPPEQRAILNTLSVDAQFADENTRKMLASLAQKQNKEYADKSLGLRKKALTSSIGLRRQDFDENVRQDRIATGIGLGQVAAETYFGGQRDEINQAILKKKLDFMNRYYGGA